VPYQGPDLQFDPVEHNDERGSGQEDARALVVAGGDAPPILDHTLVKFGLTPIKTELKACG